MKKTDTLPKITIRYSAMLDEIFSIYIKSGAANISDSWKNWQPWETETLKENIRKCRQLWNANEKKILNGIQDKTNLQFSKNEITAYVTGTNPRNTSDPIIIRGTQKPEHFVEALTHELIHEIYRYNRLISSEQCTALLEEICMPIKDYSVLSHIFVYSLLCSLYQDITGNPYQFQISDFAKKITPQYQEAYSYVQNVGHEKILSDFREKIKGVESVDPHPTSS